jgi:hypothetical protein
MCKVLHARHTPPCLVSQHDRGRLRRLRNHERLVTVACASLIYRSGCAKCDCGRRDAAITAHRAVVHGLPRNDCLRRWPSCSRANPKAPLNPAKHPLDPLKKEPFLPLPRSEYLPELSGRGSIRRWLPAVHSGTMSPPHTSYYYKVIVALWQLQRLEACLPVVRDCAAAAKEQTETAY